MFKIKELIRELKDYDESKIVRLETENASLVHQLKLAEQTISQYKKKNEENRYKIATLEEENEKLKPMAINYIKLGKFAFTQLMEDLERID